MFFQQFCVEGLGCASYLVGCEDKGVAAVVDPDRNVRPYLDVAKSRGLKITHVIETHLHADHVSGNTDLAQQTGADIYLHEAAHAEFPHQTLKDGDTLQIGNVQLVARHTPGHTPESITLFVIDQTRGADPWMALTGDTLFVGDVGRPDLVGAEAAQELSGNLYDSLFTALLSQDDGLLIYPGHGAGSLCGRSIGSVRSSSLGFEWRHNPALAMRDRTSFIEYMTTNLPEQPANHKRIKTMNRQGPPPLGLIEPLPLSIQDAIGHFQRGAALLDIRSKAEYVRAHVPGSVHLEADDQLSSRIGFVLPPHLPIILLAESEADYRQVVLNLARVGYDRVVGYLDGGMDAWERAGLPITGGDIEDIEPSELHRMLSNGSRPIVVDVREPWEYAQARIPGSKLISLGELNARIKELDPQQPVAVVCDTGSRS